MMKETIENNINSKNVAKLLLVIQNKVNEPDDCRMNVRKDVGVNGLCLRTGKFVKSPAE